MNKLLIDGIGNGGRPDMGIVMMASVFVMMGIMVPVMV